MSKSIINDYTVVTCVTGNFNKVHKTNIKNAIVYTTLRDVEFTEHATQNGWQVRILPFTHSYDLREGTRQSKYVKFLKYHIPETKYVIYIDHKYKMQDIHAIKLIELIGNNSFLSFINTSSIYHEFFKSLSFPRYKNDIDEMIKTITENENKGYDNLKLFYGGMMVYNTAHQRFKIIKQKMEEYTEKYYHVQDQLLFPIAIKDETKVLIHNTIDLKHEHIQEPIPNKTY
jgi:hypothetical protein